MIVLSAFLAFNFDLELDTELELELELELEVKTIVLPLRTFSNLFVCFVALLLCFFFFFLWFHLIWILLSSQFSFKLIFITKSALHSCLTLNFVYCQLSSLSNWFLLLSQLSTVVWLSIFPLQDLGWDSPVYFPQSTRLSTSKLDLGWASPPSSLPLLQRSNAFVVVGRLSDHHY